MTTVVSIILSDIVALRDRGVWQGVINIVYSAGAGIGAPLGEILSIVSWLSNVPDYNLTLLRNKGGFLADYVGWRW